MSAAIPMLSLSTVSDEGFTHHSEWSNVPLLTRDRLGWRRTISILKTLILFLFSTGYLTFCYTAHHRTIPLKNLGSFSITPDHLETIKSAITTLNIAVITLALYPVSDLFLELKVICLDNPPENCVPYQHKSEEFFNALVQRTRGVPLSTINVISTPISGKIDAISAVIARRCSRFFVAATVGSLVVFATSILAPTACMSPNLFPFPADLPDIDNRIGAVANNSVYNTTFFSLAMPNEDNAENNADYAASILWAETYLGVQYAFATAASTEADIPAFIVPKPLNLPMTSTARWLTDVIGLRPSCTWASTNITQLIILSNVSDTITSMAGVYLEGLDLDVAIESMDFYTFESLATILVLNPTSQQVFNHSTLEPPTDGSTVFLVGRCSAGCSIDSNYNTVWLDFTGIPTFTVQVPPSATFGSNQSWQLAYLVCKPNAVIETREVRAEGNAMLTVQPLSEGQQLTSQGNLFELDTTTMLSVALSQITNAGPSNSSSLSGLGSELQLLFLFGAQQVNSMPSPYADHGPGIANVSFLPVANLSTSFAQMLQSASKAYLSGYLGTAFVPARLSAFEVVFVSSWPLIMISTATFLLLYILVGVLYLRKQGEEFNLLNVARVVHGSNLPEEVSRLVLDSGTGAGCSEQDVIGKMGDRAIVLQRGEDSDVLQVT